MHAEQAVAVRFWLDKLRRLFCSASLIVPEQASLCILLNRAYYGKSKLLRFRAPLLRYTAYLPSRVAKNSAILSPKSFSLKTGSPRCSIRAIRSAVVQRQKLRQRSGFGFDCMMHPKKYTKERRRANEPTNQLTN